MNIQNSQSDESPAQHFASARPSRVRFSKRKPMNKNIIILVVLAVITLGVIFAAVRSLSSGGNADVAPTPTPFEIEQPTPTEKVEIDKSQIKINVLNGTGIAKEASYLQGKLANLEFENIEVGNADNENYESCVIMFGDNVQEEVKKEILELLEDSYDSVRESSKNPSNDFDIEIITGTRPGVSRPTTAPTASPEEEDEEEISPTPTEEQEPTATPTEEDTPTPTP